MDNIDSELEGFGYDVGSRESLWIPVVSWGWATYVEIAGQGSSAFLPSSEKFYQILSSSGGLKSAMDKAAGNETGLSRIKDKFWLKEDLCCTGTGEDACVLFQEKL